MTHNSLRISKENMANIVVSIYDNRDSQVTYIFIASFWCIPFKLQIFFTNLSEGKKDIPAERSQGGASSNRCKAEQVL